MQLEFLCSLRVPSLVKQRLGMLPPNLQKIYEENYSQKLESYQEEERRIVVNAFRFLLCVRGKLHTGGLLQALSVFNPENPPLSPDLLLDLCFNFIDVDHQLDVFRFAHLSVREYLEAKTDYERTSNHALAAECCVRLLASAEIIERYEFVDHFYTPFPFGNLGFLPFLERAFETVAQNGVKSLVRPKLVTPTEDTLLTEFHKYACVHWAFHLASSGGFRIACPLKDLSYTFMMDHQYATSKAYCVWSEDTCRHWYSLDRVDKKLMEELLGALGIDGIFSAKESFNPKEFSDQWRGGGTGQAAAGGDAARLCNEPCAVKYSIAADYLFAACVWGFGDLLEIRIRAGLNFTNGQVLRYSGRALFTATKFGNYAAVRLLLEQGAVVEWTDFDGRTALCQSVIARSLPTCEALLERGADPGISDKQGNTPLCWAVYNSDLEMMKMLLRYEAGINGKDGHFSNRPLVCAVAYGGLEVAQVLLNHGADPNTYDDWYDSPLHCAAMKGDLEMMRMLLNYGARAPTNLKRSKGNRNPYIQVQDPIIKNATNLLREHGCTFEDEDEDEPELEEKDQVSASIIQGSAYMGSASIIQGLASITGGYTAGTT